jgi:hypothetical protein
LITRNEHNHVVLECRGPKNCQHVRIVSALEWTNDHLYAETPDWLIGRLGRVSIQPASFGAVPEAASASLAQEPLEGRMPVEISLQPVTEGASGTLAAGSHSCEPSVVSTVGAGADAPSRARFPRSAPTRTAPRIDRAPGNARELDVARVTSAARTGKRDRASSITILTRLVSNVPLFRSADGHFCAQVLVGMRLEIYGLRSAGFRDWLIDGYMDGQTEPPSNWAIQRVVGMLEARARFTAGMSEVFVRVGHNGGGGGGDAAYFLDLGDSSGQAVAIGDQGWYIIDRPGVHFRRPGGLQALPSPVHGGSIDLLRPYVNLTEPDFRLMIAWLTAALRPVGPYPILVLNGEQSSGKSTLARVLRLLIDPHACPALALPSSTENLMTTAVNGWLLVYENISAVPDWLSDGLCQLAFGGGFASRALFTNDERSDLYAQRPVILIGIDDFALRGDLRDRSVFLHLPPIPETRRRTERSLWPAFRADSPRILGAVLDAIVGGLRELPSVNLKSLPRMADFAEWGEATSRGLGWGAGTFVSTYMDNRKDATEALLEDSPVATVALALARTGIHWSGKPQELHQEFSRIAGKTPGPRWPKTISMFGSELRRIAPQLRLHGLSISFERKGGDRIVTLKTENTTST